MRLREVASVFIALLSAPAVASAEPAWTHDSPVSEQSAGYLPCVPSTGRAFDEVLPAIDYAEAFLDPAAPVPLGGVQYVRVQWFATGGDYCRDSGGTGTSIEIILPPGAELALGAQNAAFCGFSIELDAAACPVTTAPGEYGGTRLLDARSGQGAPWPLSDGLNKTRLQIPVRFTRPVTTFGASAERRCNALPCPPDQSGGRVQFVVRFVPGTGAAPSWPLVSTVGLTGGRTLLEEVPSRVRRATLRRGMTLKVGAAGPGRVRATLKAGSRTLGSASRRATAAGIVSLRLRADAGRTRRARLTISSGGRQQSVTLRIGG